MSQRTTRFAVLASLLVGLTYLPGCGGSDEPVVLDPPPAPTNVDPEKVAKEKDEAMKGYDPRSGSPTGSGSSSPSTL